MAQGVARHGSPTLCIPKIQRMAAHVLESTISQLLSVSLSAGKYEEKRRKISGPPEMLTHLLCGGLSPTFLFLIFTILPWQSVPLKSASPLALAFHG